MAVPNLTFTLEPSESGNVDFLLLAPQRNGGAQNAQLSLVLALTNNEAAPLSVNRVEVWVGGSRVTTFPVPNGQSNGWAITLVIAPGATRSVFFEANNNVALGNPTPPSVTVSVFCDGFADPATNTVPLQRHVCPVAGGFRFPSRAEDLGDGEFWRGISAAHATAFGSQLFAYDLGVVGKDGSGWSVLRSGADGSQNDHWRSYGKPVRAMAEGTVVSFDNTIPDNVPPNAGAPPGTPVEGSHFWLQHGTDVVLYAHLQGASMPAALLMEGAIVHEGDSLGLSGNSGNSTNPHLHIHAIKGTAAWGGPLRPLPFRNAACLDQTLLASANDNGPWAGMDNVGPPNVMSLIYPDAAGLPKIPDSLIDKIVKAVKALVEAIKRFFRF